MVPRTPGWEWREEAVRWGWANTKGKKMAEREEGRWGQGPAGAAGSLAVEGRAALGCVTARHHKLCMST